MINLFLIFVYLALGFLLKTIKPATSQFSSNLNFVVINICLPALALWRVPELSFSKSLWMPVSVAWIVFLLAALYFLALQKIIAFNKQTLGCLLLCCGLFNSAFVGFPVVSALYGSAGLSIAVITDQPGSFLVLSTLGIFSTAFFSSGKSNPGSVAKKIFSFPPFWAFVLAICLLLLNVKLPNQINDLLSFISAFLTPLALLSVGLQLNFSFDVEMKKELIAGLFFKLILAPLFIFSLFYFLENETSLILKVSVLQSAMAPMVSGSILAIKNGLNPKLANALVGIGIPVSFATLAVWYMLLEFVF